MIEQATLWHRKRWRILLPTTVVIALACSFALHQFSTGPLILVFDVDGKHLLRERGIFASHDYRVDYGNEGWFIQRPDDIARKYIKEPLPKTTQIHSPYKTRLLDEWYYVLEPDGRIMACRGDNLHTHEVRYVNDMWSIQIDGKWMEAFFDY